MYIPTNYSGYSAPYPVLSENNDLAAAQAAEGDSANSAFRQEFADKAASEVSNDQERYAPSAPPLEAWDNQPEQSITDIKEVKQAAVAAELQDTGLSKSVLTQVGDLGLSALSGLVSLSFATLKFGGSVGWSIASSGFKTLIGSSQDQQHVLGKRAYELMSKWKTIEHDLNETMKVTGNDFSNLLAEINGLPLIQASQSKNSLARLEGMTKIFEKSMKETFNEFKEVLKEEKENKSHLALEQGLSKSSLARLERTVSTFKEKVNEIQDNLYQVLEEVKRNIS